MTPISNCPCCQSSAQVIEDPKRLGFGKVQCVLCGLRTEGGEAIAVAVAAWNRREVDGTKPS